MARAEFSLVVMAGPCFGETVPLKEGRNVVGSDPSAEIYFVTSLLAGSHFSIVRKGRRIALERDGGVTWLNNSPVERATLKDGDLIFAGGILFRYVEEGSGTYFYVGDLFYGRERRRYPRFTAVSKASAYLPENGQKLEILSIRTVGRGGIGLFSKQAATVGSSIHIVLYSMDLSESMVAESVTGTVASSAPWEGSLFLLNVRFQEPVAEERQPNLYRYLIELEKFF